MFGIGLIVTAISGTCWGIAIVAIISAVSLAVQRSKSNTRIINN